MDVYLVLVIPGTILTWFFVRMTVGEMNPLVLLIILLPAILGLPLAACPTQKQLRKMEEEEERKRQMKERK